MFRVITSSILAIILVLGLSSPSQAVSNEKVLTIAKSLQGSPYRSGGASPAGFDCSGFTYYVYKQLGHKIPRNSHQQYRAAKIVSKKSAKSGDLVFLMSKNGYAYHVGIYLGNNKMIHSPKPGHSVRVEKIWTSNVRFGKV
jgi:cell wall-associated NlpC family hydrolase